jgi:hypothetical protein
LPSLLLLLLPSVLSMMLPFALAFMVAGMAMTAAWVFFDWPLGPGASVHYSLPGANRSPISRAETDRSLTQVS